MNYGTVNARKEGGGIVGQMEPSSVLQYNQDTLQELQGELDTFCPDEQGHQRCLGFFQ